MALHMQQLLKQAGHDVPSGKPVLEVNPTHPILGLLDQEQDDDRFADWSRLLLDQALLAEGGQLEDGAGFVKRMNEMFMARMATAVGRGRVTRAMHFCIGTTTAVFVRITFEKRY